MFILIFFAWLACVSLLLYLSLSLWRRHPACRAPSCDLEVIKAQKGFSSKKDGFWPKAWGGAKGSKKAIFSKNSVLEMTLLEPLDHPPPPQKLGDI